MPLQASGLKKPVPNAIYRPRLRRPEAKRLPKIDLQASVRRSRCQRWVIGLGCLETEAKEWLYASVLRGTVAISFDQGSKQNPFFLARAAAFLLCKFRRPRASCHHASLLPPPREPPREPPPATAVSSRLQPPPREPPREPPPATAVSSCRCLVPLSVSLQVFRRPSTTTRTLSFFCRNCRAAVFFKVNFECVFV